MRFCAALFAALFLAAWSTVPATHHESRVVSANQSFTRAPQDTSIDSVVQFLLTSAATDFLTHGPSDSLHFREVHIGHIVVPDGQKQYLLCGQFLPLREGDKGEWIPFVTIKTSGYEQWIGAQASAFCKNPSVIWDKSDDLSTALERQLDALR